MLPIGTMIGTGEYLGPNVYVSLAGNNKYTCKQLYPKYKTHSIQCMCPMNVKLPRVHVYNMFVYMDLTENKLSKMVGVRWKSMEEGW